jgi:hypothetical protein
MNAMLDNNIVSTYINDSTTKGNHMIAAAITTIRTTQKRLVTFIRVRFPTHDWSHHEYNCTDFRTCKICGRIEELDLGSGFAGAAWLPIRKGAPEAHAK